MRGKDLYKDFGPQVKDTMLKTLRTYRPEIEFALGPAKITVRPVQVQNQELQQNSDTER